MLKKVIHLNKPAAFRWRFVKYLQTFVTTWVLKQKIAKLKFVNWTSKIERILKLKMANEQSFIAFLFLFMDFILLGIKSHKI